MSDGTCPTPDCQRPIQRRGYCDTCYRRRIREGQMERVADRRHKVSGIDETALTAICSKCGPIKVATLGNRTGQGSICPTAEQAAARKIRHGFDREAARALTRLRHRAKLYGLTLSELRKMEQVQRGQCAICGSGGNLHIDHDHATGAVRGMLCRSCNVGIGHLRDDIALVRSAVRYLRKTSGPLAPSPAEVLF